MSDLKRTYWERFQRGTDAIVKLDEKLPEHGHSSAYQYADIPFLNADGWKMANTRDGELWIEESSRITDHSKNLWRLDFSYFKTLVDIPKGQNITEFKVTIDYVDDGARMLLYNKKNPEGYYLPNKDGKLNGESVTVDFTDKVTDGVNCVMIVQFDDAGGQNRLTGGVKVVYNGSEVKPDKDLKIPHSKLGWSEHSLQLSSGKKIAISAIAHGIPIDWDTAVKYSIYERNYTMKNWRLPTKTELGEIYFAFAYRQEQDENDKSRPYIHTEGRDWYWASTEKDDDNKVAYQVSMYNGAVQLHGKSTENWWLFVRDLKE